jgi:hypothetical protein
MAERDHDTHDDHPHRHGADCGHPAVAHEDHTDYVHDGHLHHVHDDHVDEHVLTVDAGNPSDCTPSHDCGSHTTAHGHDADCGHEPVPHGDHVDYLVDGHLHHPHDQHCDDHGSVAA